MKKIKTLILSMAMLLSNTSAFAQTSAVDELLKEKSDLMHESEQSSESLKHLNDEKKLLITKLVEINKQYDDVMKTQTQTQNTELTPVTISTQEIAKYISNKRMGLCKINPGEYLGEYIIQKEKVKIRFAFLPKDSVLAPKLSIVKGEQNEDLFQIEQSGYDPNATNLKGEMQATLRFQIKENNKPGEVAHAVFAGQRLNDKWLGQSSSYAMTPIACELGK